MDAAVLNQNGFLISREVVLSRQDLLLVGIVKSLESILLRAMLQLSMMFAGGS